MNNFCLKAPDETLNDVIHIIYNFIKNCYPEFHFELEKSNLNELNHKELLEITSLLMHYSCIFDRRKEFISPLCNSLMPNVQLSIRNFLERFTNTVTRVELQNFFDELSRLDASFPLISPNSKPQKSSSKGLSPLQDFLRTPTTRSRFVVSEIKRLEAALELERFEKGDLQEELKVHQEKIKSIGDQLKAKTNELSRLRSELVALENREPPYYQNDGSLEVQRRYQLEIQSLEQYVSQLQNEQEELQNELDMFKEKLKNAEAESKSYKNKLIAFEKQNEGLHEKSTFQAREIVELKFQCNELNALLNEFKGKSNDSFADGDSIFDDTRSKFYQSCSSFDDLNLANTVIDVQLQEVREENKDLKAMLKDVQNRETQLMAEVSEWQTKFNNCDKIYKKVQQDNDILSEKISSLIKLQEELNLKLTEGTKPLNSYLHKNNTLEGGVKLLNNDLVESKYKSENLNKINLKLQTDFENASEEHAAPLKIKEDNFEKLQIGQSNLQKQQSDSVEKYVNTNFQLNSFLEKCKVLDDNTECSSSNFEPILYDNNGTDLKNKQVTFTKLVERLRNNIICDFHDKKELHAKISTLEELSEQLKNQIEELMKNESVSLQQRQALQTNLRDAERHIDILNVDILKNRETIDRVNSLKSDHENTITRLENSLRENENHIKELTSLNKVLSDDVARKTDELQDQNNREKELQDSINNYKNKTRGLVEELDRKIQELIVLKEDVTRRALLEDEVYKEINKLQGIETSLVMELQSTKAQIECNRKEITAKNKKEKDLNKLIVDLNEKCKNLEEKLKINRKEIEDKTQELSQKVAETEKMSLLINNLETKNKDLVETIHTKNEQDDQKLKVMESNKSDAERKLKVTQTNLLVSARNNQKLQETLVNNEKETIQIIKELNDKRNGDQEKIKILEQDIDQKQSQQVALMRKQMRILQDKDEICKNYEKQLEIFKRKLNLSVIDQEHLQGLLNGETQLKASMQSERDLKCKEISKLLYQTEQKDKDCEEKNGKIEELMSEIEKVSLAYAVKEISVKDFELERIQLNKDIKSLKQCIEDLESERKDSLGKILELQNQVTGLSELHVCYELKCSGLEETTQKIIRELSVKNEQFDLAINDMKSLEKARTGEIQNLEETIEDYKQQIGHLTKQNNNFIFEHEKEIMNLNVEIKQLNTSMGQLSSKEIEYLQEIRLTKEELKDTMSKYTQSLQEYQETKGDYVSQIDNLTDNLHELLEKYNILDEMHIQILRDLSETRSLAESLKEEKISLENELVQVKEKFAEKYEHIRKTLMKEIEGLTQTRLGCEKELDILKLQAEIFSEDNSRLKKNLRDLTGKCLLVENEKIGLLEQLSASEASCKKLIEDYNALEFTFESHKVSSDLKLKELECEFEDKLMKLQLQNADVLKKVDLAKEAVLKHEAGYIKQIADHENQMEEKEEQMKTMRIKIMDYERHILEIKDEMQILASDLERGKVEHKDIVESLTEKLVLMQAGKQEIQNRYDLLLINMSKVEKTLTTKEEIFEEELKVKKYEICNMKGLLVTLESECKDKQTIIEELHTDLEHVVNKYKNKSAELEGQVSELSAISLKKYNNYENLIKSTVEPKGRLEKLRTFRSHLETIVLTLKENLVMVLMKSESITTEGNAQLFETKQGLQIIVEDIQQECLRISNGFSCTKNSMMNIIEKSVESILLGKTIIIETLFQDLRIEELEIQLENCKDRAEDALEQLNVFEATLIKTNLKADFKPLKLQSGKLQKENVLQNTNRAPNSESRKDDWKKKNLDLKKRLTLAENARNMFEKKLKQLREENKRLVEKTSIIDSDQHYQILFQQHMDSKQEFENKTKDYQNMYKDLQREFEEYKLINTRGENTEEICKLKQELQNIRTAYGSILTEKSKVDVENDTLHKIIDDKNTQMNNLRQIKEAYEKLLEDNNKLIMEIDTIRFKRGRDREEYSRMLQKDREEFEGRANNRVLEIRAEYEGKLEKMKDRMIKLYKDEVDKEMQKEKDQNIFLIKTVTELKEDLQCARNTIKKLEYDRKKALEDVRQLERESVIRKREANTMSSRESLASVSSIDRLGCGSTGKPNGRNTFTSFEIPRNVRSSTSSLTRDSISRRTTMEEGRISTLPRTVIEEVTTTIKHTTVNSMPSDLSQNFEMEDEGELFNNKYLTDLKEGRCLPSFGRESTTSRVSELAFRNSLCPPHLKSSYPAETQFSSPSVFKEEDIKSGHIEFDDSMSSKLLPGEKPRTKKDIGTTSYKRPGPPTPSKNGGRVSLESNKIHPKEVLREINDKTPKRTTPNKLKSLFMGSRSTRETAENQPATPNKTKRLSIFRKR